MGTRVPETINVCTVVIKNNEGQVLTVRKRGTRALMLPGGKPEPGESTIETVVREVAEELGFDLEASALQALGAFTGPAANERGCTVHAKVFQHPFVQAISPRAEIEHVEWVAPTDRRADLAPLLRDEVFPVLCQQHLPETSSAKTPSP